jgi:hypothetical protein
MREKISPCDLFSIVKLANPRLPHLCSSSATSTDSHRATKSTATGRCRSGRSTARRQRCDCRPHCFIICCTFAGMITKIDVIGILSKYLLAGEAVSGPQDAVLRCGTLPLLCHDRCEHTSGSYFFCFLVVFLSFSMTGCPSTASIRSPLPCCPPFPFAVS